MLRQPPSTVEVICVKYLVIIGIQTAMIMNSQRSTYRLSCPWLTLALVLITNPKTTVNEV